MKLQSINSILIMSLFLLTACNNKPKVVDQEPTIPGEVATMEHGSHPVNTKPDDHLVTVEEVLQASKYTYLSVREDDNVFWIAVPKQEAKVGDKFAYTGGLLKKNFESKEFNKTFETIYLVSKFKNLGDKVSESASSDVDLQSVEGRVKISDIIKDPAKYEGKEITVAGECTKVNPNIMGKNWVHLKDGSADDFDFTITTVDNVLTGSKIVMKGTIGLNVDFGAGYIYDIILQDAVVIK